jgi:DNA (cytosine-5)-methyltransferase 1
MNGLDLFSGIDGIGLALSPWVRPVAYCERDTFAQADLLSRMQNGSIPHAPVWDDVRTLNSEELNTFPDIDIIYGGFPCQDISVAGRGEGLGGERSGLFFEIVRLVQETRAPFVFLENVPAIRTRGLREVVRTFTDLGYDCRWTCVSAAEVGANHIRKRWFLLAYDHSVRLRDGSERSSQGQAEANRLPQHDGAEEPLADSDGIGRAQASRTELETDGPPESGEAMAYSCGAGLAELDSASESDGTGFRPGGFAPIWSPSWWSTEPNVGRVADGIPNRVDRIKCLGNAVVPLQARTAFKRLMGL